MIRIFAVLILLFIVHPTYSQLDSFPEQKIFPSLGIQFHKGFIIPHSESIKSISYSKPWVIQADLSFHYATQKAVNYCNCYPRLGISAWYINFDNTSILGSGFALTPYVEPYFSGHKNVNFSIRFAVGAVYLNNVFNAETNPMNLFYSTPVSFLLSLGLSGNYRFRSQWNARITANYNHISNGGNRNPNKGINFPTISFGIDYLIKPVHLKRIDNLNRQSVQRRGSIKIALLGTSRKPFPGENSRFWVLGVTSQWNYLFGRINALLIGAEWVNDLSLREMLKRTGTEFPDHNRGGILLGHEFQIGRFRFSQQLGIYIYTPVKPRDPVYQRWGLDFLINKNIYVGVNLKTHRHVADFMDFRIGYIFN